VWGAVLGAAIGGGFILTTAAVVLFGAKLPPSTAGLIMLVSWAGKVLVALIVVAILQRFHFYDRVVLFLTVVGALVIVLGAETYGVVRQKVPYVTTTDPDTASGTRE
jgi:glucan phosphoethanolaminetransferase (alkaline phosphatase superfamily)